MPNPQIYNPPFTFYFFLTVIVLALIALLTVIFSIGHKLTKNQILNSFTVQNNIKAFSHKAHNFNIFNGIKSLCMFWVILGHTFQVRMQNNVNMLTLEHRTRTPFYLSIFNAFFAVDTFFFMGGFLFSYSFLRN